MPDIRSSSSFIAYSSRSGSTFVAARVAERYDVTVIPEFQTAYWLLEQSPDTPLSVEGMEKAVRRDRQLAWVTPERLADWLEDPQLPRDAFAWIAGEWAASRGGAVAGSILYKVGGVMAVWPAFSRHFPASPVVNVVRDGRAVVNSLLHSPRPYGGSGTMGRDDAVHCARQWSTQVDQQTAIAAAEPDRVLQLRYEDVMQDLDGSLRRTAEFCGWTAGSGATAFSVTESERAIHELVAGPPVQRRVEGWRQELSREAQVTVEVIGARTLARHGYTAHHASTSPVERRAILGRAYLRHWRIAVADATRRLRAIEDLATLRARVRHRLTRLRGRVTPRRRPDGPSGPVPPPSRSGRTRS